MKDGFPSTKPQVQGLGAAAAVLLEQPIGGEKGKSHEAAEAWPWPCPQTPTEHLNELSTVPSTIR